jgi:hypothetical protein
LILRFLSATYRQIHTDGINDFLDGIASLFCSRL